MPLILTRGLGGAPGQLLTRGFGTTPVVLPASLLAALKIYWATNSLDIALAPLFAEGWPKPAPALPVVMIDAIRSVLPGITATDRPVEMWMTVWAGRADTAETIANGVMDRLGTPDEEPPRAIPRDSLVWTRGSETLAERGDCMPEITPKTYPGMGQVYKYRMHYTFWINGRA